MREFNEADKEKKRERIQMIDNPANLSDEKLSELETAVKSSLKDGYLLCPVAWKIAKEAGVPKSAVGAITDKLAVRITDCQLGCFKVDKTPYEGPVDRDTESKLDVRLDALSKDNKLACAAAFDLAHQLKLPPMAVAEVLNIRNMKIRDCQLGCF